jgi:uncharacterized protein YprB with RNaseH-like and TPR domain
MKQQGNALYRKLKGMKKAEIMEAAMKTCKCGHSYLAHPRCWEREQGQLESIGFLDIETSNLKADFGIVFSYAIKHRGSDKIEGRVLTAEEMKKGVYDKKLIQEACEDIRKFDRVVGHYSTRFDLPFLRSRALYYGLDFPVYKEVKHTDTFFMARSRLCISRRRLETICEFLGIPAKGHKLNQKVWLKALGGDDNAFAYIWEHNVEDVISTEAVWEKLDAFCMTNGTSI